MQARERYEDRAAPTVENIQERVEQLRIEFSTPLIPHHRQHLSFGQGRSIGTIGSEGIVDIDNGDNSGAAGNGGAF